MTTRQPSVLARKLRTRCGKRLVRAQPRFSAPQKISEIFLVHTPSNAVALRSKSGRLAPLG
jgi:hypothetical protein